MKRAYLSLGSNVGDRVSHIRKACELLPAAGVEVRRVSSLYRTEPVDFSPQRWFINCVAEAETDLMPLRLLKALQSVERQLGRRPGIPKGPRPIDIDILFYDDQVVETEELIIPHPRLTEREFVLVPLDEIAPEMVHPVSGLTVRQMRDAITEKQGVFKWEETA